MLTWLCWDIWMAYGSPGLATIMLVAFNWDRHNLGQLPTGVGTLEAKEPMSEARWFYVSFKMILKLILYGSIKSVLCLVAQLCPTLCNPIDNSLPGSSVHKNYPGKNTGVDCHPLLQGIFPIQGANPSLQHCRLILYRLSHQGRPGILTWVAYPFFRGSSQPRNWTGVFCLAGGFFTSWDLAWSKELSSVCDLFSWW